MEDADMEQHHPHSHRAEREHHKRARMGSVYPSSSGSHPPGSPQSLVAMGAGDVDAHSPHGQGPPAQPGAAAASAHHALGLAASHLHPIHASRVPAGYVLIPAVQGVYAASNYKPEFETLYTPLRSETLINVARYDEISFAHGPAFTTDDHGNYTATVQAHLVYLWRFVESQGQLMITRTLAIESDAHFSQLRGQLLR